MSSYRSRLDIIADMLDVISENGRAKKTHIMYRANLSYKLLTKYLNHVLVACLVRSERKERCYVLTSKGEEFLEIYRNYARHHKFVEKRLQEVNSRRKTLEDLLELRHV